MFQTQTTVRVRYGETDRMGYVHHASYLLYFEVGRTEMLRSQGMTYKDMEDSGTLMPLRDAQIEYMQPALYDEELTITTTVREVPGVRMKFFYGILNSNGELVCKGTTTLVFVDAKTRQPTRPPEFFLEKIKKHF